MLALPVIDVGAAVGIGSNEIAFVVGGDIPHVLFAFTDIDPEVKFDVTAIVFVVDVPLQPDGKVHVYDVAPGTGVAVYTSPARFFPHLSQVIVVCFPIIPLPPRR